MNVISPCASLLGKSKASNLFMKQLLLASIHVYLLGDSEEKEARGKETGNEEQCLEMEKHKRGREEKEIDR